MEKIKVSAFFGLQIVQRFRFPHFDLSLSQWRRKAASMPFAILPWFF